MIHMCYYSDVTRPRIQTLLCFLLQMMPTRSSLFKKQETVKLQSGCIAQTQYSLYSFSDFVELNFTFHIETFEIETLKTVKSKKKISPRSEAIT